MRNKRRQEVLNKKSFLTIILACALVFALCGGAVAAQGDLEKVLNKIFQD